MDTIFFVLSKVVQFCIEPLNWVIVFVAFSLLFLSLRKPHFCKRFLLFALADLLLVGWLPTSEVFLRTLENSVPKTQLEQMVEADFGGIIILGGAIEGGEIAVDRGEISIGSAAERVTKAFELIRKYPDLPFIFSGFSGRLSPKGISEADAFKRLVAEQSLPDKNAHYENQSRNTYENAMLMKPMILELGSRGAKEADASSKPWLLITSASHMYRSVKIFQKQGIEVIPVPVDYQTANTLPWWRFDLEDGAQNWNKLAHEVIGLVGYWDVVAFDEFAGRKKKTDKALVDIMKNYMANKTFSRGVETLGAEASMVFVGNTSHNVAYMLKHSDLFEELPESYHDSAFLDRLHFYIPGWEVDVIRSEMFSSGFGFVVDYIAEVLKSLRAQDYSDSYTQHGLQLSNSISTRDRDGIHKTYSGLLKVVFPNRDETAEEAEQLLRFAIEGRKRVKDQIVRIDKTMESVEFSYTTPTGKTVIVETLEEIEFPVLYGGRLEASTNSPDVLTPEVREGSTSVVFTETAQVPGYEKQPSLFVGHKEFQENQRGISFAQLFIPYVRDAKQITITDPYIRKFHQARNLMEFVEALARVKSIADEIVIKLRTSRSTDGEESLMKQVALLANVEEGAALAGITFDYEFDDTLHDRSIETDNGWKIALGRGLDIFQNVSNDAFDLANRLQEYRQVKAFSITYIQSN